MARNFTPTSSYISIESAVIAAAPFSVSVWFYPNTITANMNIFWMGDKDVSNDYFALEAGGADANDPFVVVHRNSSGESKARTSTAFNGTAWNHGLGVWTSNSSRSAYLNGAGLITNTDVRTTPAVDRTGIGRYLDSTPGATFNGNIAEVALWDAALTADDAVILSKGFSPLLVKPQNLVSYWRLIRDDLDIVDGFNMSFTNSPTFDIHPRIYYPSSYNIAPFAAAGASTSVKDLIGMGMIAFPR